MSKKNEAVSKEQSALAWAIANIKKPTKLDAQRLRIGDVIQVFYNDVFEPTTEVVVAPCDRGDSIYQVRSVSKEDWDMGKLRTRGFVNSEYWRVIGKMKFSISKA